MYESESEIRNTVCQRGMRSSRKDYLVERVRSRKQRAASVAATEHRRIAMPRSPALSWLALAQPRLPRSPSTQTTTTSSQLAATPALPIPPFTDPTAFPSRPALRVSLLFSLYSILLSLRAPSSADTFSSN